MLQTVHTDTDTDDMRSRLLLMREHLKKSIELSPGYLNAYEMLADVSLTLNDEVAETEKLLKRFATSGRSGIRLRLAELMMLNGEEIAARTVLKPLKDSADDDRVKERADRLLDEIQDRLEENDAKNEMKNEVKDEPSRTSEAADGVAAAAPPSRPARIPRAPTPDQPHMEGDLLAIDCTRGMTLRLKSGGRELAFHGDDASTIEFVSYNASVTEFRCGLLKAPLPVVVVYKPASGTQYVGEPIRVDFVGRK
jgi:hypothetical protein